MNLIPAPPPQPPNTTIPLSTFHPFPYLPLELRLKIYAYILSTPRTVSVYYARKPNPSIPLSTPYRNHPPSHAPLPLKHLSTFTGWATTTLPPALLHVSQESRSEALKTHVLAFGSDFHPPKVWFNFSVDTLHLTKPPPQPASSNFEPDSANATSGPASYLLDLFLGGGFNGANDSERVQFLKIELGEEVYGRRNFCWDEVRLFPVVREVTLVVWEEEDVGKEAARNRLMEYFENRLGLVMEADRAWKVPRVWVEEGRTGVGWGVLGEEKE